MYDENLSWLAYRFNIERMFYVALEQLRNIDQVEESHLVNLIDHENLIICS